MKKLLVFSTAVVLFCLNAEAKIFSYQEFLQLLRADIDQAKTCEQYLVGNSANDIKKLGKENFLSKCGGALVNPWDEEFFFNPANKQVGLKCQRTKECLELLEESQVRMMNMISIMREKGLKI
jgi:hypothetical protein